MGKLGYECRNAVTRGRQTAGADEENVGAMAQDKPAVLALAFGTVQKAAHRL